MIFEFKYYRIILIAALNKAIFLNIEYFSQLLLLYLIVLFKLILFKSALFLRLTTFLLFFLCILIANLLLFIYNHIFHFNGILIICFLLLCSFFLLLFQIIYLKYVICMTFEIILYTL